MKNEKFKQLIIEAYKKSKEFGNLVGITYGAIFTRRFSEITNIKGFVNDIPIDMLHLKSLLTGIEVDIYEYDFVDFKVKNSESTIYVKLKNKEVPLMF